MGHHHKPFVSLLPSSLLSFLLSSCLLSSKLLWGWYRLLFLYRIIPFLYYHPSFKKTQTFRLQSISLASTFLISHSLLNLCQSRFWLYHSIWSSWRLFLKMTNYVYLPSICCLFSILLLVDLSSVFEPVDLSLLKEVSSLVPCCVSALALDRVLPRG